MPGQRVSLGLWGAENAFVISNVRNPCALYVSLWAFGIEGKGRYHQNFVAAHKHDPVLSRVFSTTPADHRAMANFTRASQGELSRRYREYVPDLAAVDCWVHTENMEADVGRCLLRFAAQAGPEMRQQQRRAAREAVADYNVHGTSHGPRSVHDDDPCSGVVLRQDAHVFDNLRLLLKPDDGGHASGLRHEQRARPPCRQW